MRIPDYDRIVCLVVDHRHADDWPRVRELVRSKGGEAACFVDGKGELLPSELYNQISPPPPVDWHGGPGSFCHFTAMKEIIRLARVSKVQTLLFLEDDVIFDGAFDDVVESACRQIDEHGIVWDVLYYGANHSGARVQEVAPNLLRVFGSQTTHCLGIRNTAFEPILRLGASDPIDFLISDALHPVLGCYAIWPNVAFQKPGFSYISMTNVNYSGYFQSKGNPME